MPWASSSGTSSPSLAVRLDLLPVDRRQLRLGVELVRVALVDGPRTDVLGLRDLLAAYELHGELGPEPAPLREAVMRLRDQLAVADGIRRLRGHIVGEHRHLALGRRGLATAVVEHAIALGGVDRSEPHLIRGRPDEVHLGGAVTR